MKFGILLSVCVSALGSQIVEAAEGEIPKFDITASCQGSGRPKMQSRCLQNERGARDQLAKVWPQIKQSDASRCVQITTNRAAGAGYVELLTCLQAAETDSLGPLPEIAK
jgi:hypothetical protein